MRVHRLVGPAATAALLLLAGLFALGGLVGFFAKANRPSKTYSPPGGDPGAGLESFSALALLAWPTPTPTPTPLPLSPTEPSVSENAAAPADVASQPARPSPESASEGQAPSIADYQNYDMASAVLAYVNGARSAQGLGALTSGAQSYAQLLTQLNTLSHDLNGGLLARIHASNYAGGSMGEALWEGWGNYGASDVVNDWLNSPSHRAILLGAYVDAGVACYVHEANGQPNTRCALDVGGP